MRFTLESLKKAVEKLKERRTRKPQPLTDLVSGRVYLLTVNWARDLAAFTRRRSTVKFDFARLDRFLFSESQKPTMLTRRPDGATFNLWTFTHPVYGGSQMVDIDPVSCGPCKKKPHEACISFQSCTCPCERCFAIYKFHSRRYTEILKSPPDFIKLAKRIAVGWAPSSFGDPNMGDAETLGTALAYAMKIPPPPIPSRETGLAIIGVIERRMIGLTLIRNLSPEALMDRIWMSIGEIQLLPEMPIPATYSFVYGLSAWGACISAMKYTRPAYGMQNPVAYDQDLRFISYYTTEYGWKRAFLRGNPWPKFGVTLAKEFAVSRGDVVIDDWVPKESPYWDAERIVEVKVKTETAASTGLGLA